MRLLVTGSAGFIGARLAPLLVARGHQVLGIDSLLLGQEAPATGGAPDFSRVDIRAAAAVEATFERFRPDGLIHLAAIHHIPTCEANPPEALAVNVVGTQVLLDAAQRSGCGLVVFASSGAVYDWCDGPLAPERTPVRPRDVYGICKVTNEHQVMVWQGKTGGSVVVARLFNVIGTGDRNAHLIPDIVRQLPPDRGPCVVRLGNITTRRDYVHVDDAAAALAGMVDGALGPGLHVLNVGTGHEYSVAEVVGRLAAILNVACTIESEPARVRRVDRPSQVADIARTVERLGWRPRHGLDDALRLTLA